MNIDLTPEEISAVATCIVSSAIPRQSPMFAQTEGVLKKFKDAMSQEAEGE